MLKKEMAARSGTGATTSKLNPKYAVFAARTAYVLTLFIGDTLLMLLALLAWRALA